MPSPRRALDAGDVTAVCATEPALSVTPGPAVLLVVSTASSAPRCSRGSSIRRPGLVVTIVLGYAVDVTYLVAVARLGRRRAASAY